MRALALFPLHLFWSLPRDIRTAHVNRRLGQFIAYLRGLNDGIRDRPLPLLRLGLQVRLRRDDVTIIVLNWKRAGETVECLESLAAADLGGASVLVVDNGSTDRSVEIIRERFPDQEILELPENRGYAGGNNAGIRAALEAGAKGVVLLNNDTRVAWDFLSPLLWAANADPRAAAVSSALLRMDNPEMLESAYLEIYFGHGIIRHFGVNALPGEGFGERLQVEVVVGCSVLICADALRDIGLLDESYFAYHEEVDWCFRARRAGYRNYYEPYSRVWHNKSSTTASMTKPVVANREVKTGPQLPGAVPLPWNPIQTYLGARNSVRFIRRHANPWRKLYFALSTLYGVPLEFCAAVLRRESDLKIGAWNYRRTLYMICFGPERRQRSVSEWVGGIFRAPVALFFRFPREIRQAHEEGRTAQIIEHVHGLWDGIRNRPLPLERLGLR
jgi:GT2 family glycosyltransferase